MNDQVVYTLDLSDTEKPSARDVHIFGFAWSCFTLVCASVVPLLGLYACGVWLHLVPFYPVALIYICMSLSTILAYHHDKCAARTGAWRMSEKDLHLLEMFCGWPGAFLAQLFFRHKLKKLHYQLIFWLIVVVHGTVWYLLASDLPIRKCAGLIPKNVASIRAFLSSSQSSDKPSAYTPPPVPPQPKPVVTHSFTATPPATPASPHPEPALTHSSTPAPLSAAVALTNGAPAAPLILGSGERRSLVSAPPQLRRLSGEIKAISPSTGILVALPAEIGTGGLIAPSNLVADFPRRFRVGEQITVAVQRISIKGRHTQVDLLLVEQ
jgi:uncharacterized membrane protein YsdA (DUF1294 family)